MTTKPHLEFEGCVWEILHLSSCKAIKNAHTQRTHTHTHIPDLHVVCLLNKTKTISGFQPVLQWGGVGQEKVSREGKVGGHVPPGWLRWRVGEVRDSQPVYPLSALNAEGERTTVASEQGAGWLSIS